MKKHKPSKPAKGAAAAPMHDDAAHTLLELALDLTELDEYETVPDELQRKNLEFRRIIRKCLQQKRDAVLGEALELAYEEDEAAFSVLRNAMQEDAENVIFRREEGADIEVNAFVIPFFVRSAGGLREEQCFQDEQAFDQLHHSIQDAGLESGKARVVLVAHAYHLDEIERITFGHLHEMVVEAHASMTRKKLGAAPAISRSISGWPEHGFAPEDSAVELRFLLGFALKTLDDPFYQVPEKEAAADRYFEMRAERFHRWAKEIVPVLKRCLVTDGRDLELDFLYQDLFYGGKAAGIAEYQMLQMITALQHALQERGAAAEATEAILGPVELDAGPALRVSLYAKEGGGLLASFDKPLDDAQDIGDEAEDACDALRTIGLASFSLAKRFDTEGQPINPRPLAPR